MKTVPLSVLKRNLSSLINEAAAGEPILVTRHRRPLVCLVSSDLRLVHVGRRFGKARLAARLRSATRGKYLAALRADRQSDRGDDER